MYKNNDKTLLANTQVIIAADKTHLNQLELASESLMRNKVHSKSQTIQINDNEK